MPQKQAKTTQGNKPRLPDSSPHEGPFKSFASDPGWDESWWWLVIPVILAVSLIVIHAVSKDFYTTWILPEGYGFLELSQFIIASTATALAIKLAFRPYVRANRLVFWFVCLMALGCFYIAGEEQSWGQQFFNWQTPEFWASVNRQQETNLHNTIPLFGKKPRAVLEIGILTGGLILPLLARFYPVIRANRWALFFPPDALVPFALGMLLFKIVNLLLNSFQIPPLVSRPSEAIEIFIYLFLLTYMIQITRRIYELEREAAS